MIGLGGARIQGYNCHEKKSEEEHRNRTEYKGEGDHEGGEDRPQGGEEAA